MQRTSQDSFFRHTLCILVAGAMGLCLAAGGCSDKPPLQDSLVGTWRFELLNHPYAEETFDIEIVADADDWFGSRNLTTNCGMDGLFGDWSGDWRDVDLEVDEHGGLDTPAGTLFFICIVDVFPVVGVSSVGFSFSGKFIDDIYTGRVDHKVIGGGKHTGPIPYTVWASLFVARRIDPTTVAREREGQAPTRRSPQPESEPLAGKDQHPARSSQPLMQYAG